MALSETQLEFDKSTATFDFSEIDGSVYQISGSRHKMVKIGTSYNDLKIAPKTSRKSFIEHDYEMSASGVRIGNFFWIFGGIDENQAIAWGKFMPIRKSMLFHMKKLSWLTGMYLT